jgi:glycosyltransferase involved in cell wall biosynthesis
VEGLGGVTSFRLKFEQGLRARGVDVIYDLNELSDAILVLAGTKNLYPLWLARNHGERRIVQRLDGMNWVHRVRWTGLRYTLRAIYGNGNLSLIRSKIAEHLIYQSQFVKGWWDREKGAARVPSSVILNGVDLNQYSPLGAHERPTDLYRLLVVEGSLAGGLDSGLFYAVDLAKQLSKKHKIELVIVGRVDANTKKRLQRQKDFTTRFVDAVPREEIPFLERSSHLLFSAEVNPPCPNSVIEAMACGLPVVGFDTGSLSELVQRDAGQVVAHGANPWKLERPDIPSLADAAEEVLLDNERFRTSARERAEAVFGLDPMVDEYLKVLLG